MKPIDVTAFIARILKQSVEDYKLTGSVDVHMDCSQGTACKVSLSISEKKTTVFTMDGTGEKKLA